MRHIVTIEWHHVRDDICGPRRVPRLAPHKLEVLGESELLLDLVMSALDEHVGEVGALVDVSHGGGVAEGVDGPGVSGEGGWSEVVNNPSMAFNHLTVVNRSQSI